MAITNPHWVWIGLALTLGAVGCSNETAEPTNTPSDLDDPDIRLQIQGTTGAADNHPGAALYADNCASCHEVNVARAPARNIMELLAPEAILASMDSGVMQQQASALSAEERRQIVSYLVGEPDQIDATQIACSAGASEFDWTAAPVANGWGISHTNERFLSADVAGVTAANVQKLELQWAFDFPGATRARSHPSIAGGALHVGSQSGTVYALDLETGCVRWRYEAGAEVRTGITIPDWSGQQTPRAVGYFADVIARTHAIDLESGELIWRSKVDEHPNATGTAQPVHFEDRVYQPVSSLEVVPAANPAYACCTFRGSIAILDAATGELVGKTYTIPEPPEQVGSNNVETPIYAASGAPVWNTPTLDVEKRRLYFGTGENYSSPADGNSDAIMAMDIDSGEIVWTTQTTAQDAWNLACMPFIENQTNCPVENGPDLDFGAPPVLIEADDKRILVAGQKSGEVFGLDPADGRILWREKVGRGGVQGGMHFGMAAQGTTVYVPISDHDDGSYEEPGKPGMYALDALTGERLWSRPADNVCGDRPECDPGISAAVSAIDGAVLAGHMDGRLRAYAKSDGRVLWETETDQEFTALSGRVARGGSFGGGSGPMAYNGWVFTNSGYGLYFHRPGNVLLAWKVAD